MTDLEDGYPRDAEYQGSDIDVTSMDPLTGRVELVLDDDSTVELFLNRETAEDLLSALMQFLAQGQGNDAPNPTVC